jgi:hypothetical protein
LELHDRVIILFATNLIVCGHTTSALKVLEHTGIEYLKRKLAQGNVYKLLAYLNLLDGEESLANILAYCTKSQNAFRNANSILGYTSAILMKFYVLLKLHLNNSDEDQDEEDLKEEEQKRLKLFEQCKSKLVL